MPTPMPTNRVLDLLQHHSVADIAQALGVTAATVARAARDEHSDSESAALEAAFESPTTKRLLAALQPQV